MCEPTTITALAMAAVSAVSAGVSMYGQAKQAQAQSKAISKQNKIQGEEISRQHGLELSERAREARRERGTARVLAGEAGINLGSNSFLASLQTSAMNQYNDMGLIVQNEKAQQAARQANYNSQLASLPRVSNMEALLTIGAAGASGYMQGASMYKAGAAKAGGP